MYSNEDKIIMWLSSFDFMSYKKAKFIVDNFADLEDFFGSIKVYRDSLNAVFNTVEINELISENNLTYIERVISNYNKLVY